MEIFKNLFNTIIEFKNMSPWNWMSNSDIFAVENPATGQIGYCDIMGEGGETFGLAVYLGNTGWRWLSDRLTDTPVDSFSMFMQNCISVTFENAGELEPEDKEIIKKLGLKFKGKNAYPLLRRYSPGHIPVMINEAEAEFLNVALQQTMMLAPKVKEDPNCLVSPEGDLVIRRLNKNKKGWMNHWFSPGLTPDITMPDNSFISEIAGQIKNLRTRGSEIWALGMFFLPEPVLDDNEKNIFFPLALVILDRKTGLILNNRLVDYNYLEKELLSLFAATVKKAGFIPSALETTMEEIYFTFSPVDELLRVKPVLSESIEVLDEMEQEMMRMFLKGK